MSREAHPGVEIHPLYMNINLSIMSLNVPEYTWRQSHFHKVSFPIPSHSDLIAPQIDRESKWVAEVAECQGPACDWWPSFGGFTRAPVLEGQCTLQAAPTVRLINSKR
jgi:hypothetical protein